MQNTLPLTPGNPLRNVTGLARQISLPGEHSPLRFPSFPALERTAVVGFNSPATLLVPKGSANPIAMTVFRSATFPVWADQFGSYLNVVDYANDSVVATGNSECTTFPRSAIESWTISTRTATNLRPGISYTGSGSVINAYPLLARDDNLPGPEFTYIPATASAGCVVCLRGAAGSGIVTVTVAFEVWNSPGESFSSNAYGGVVTTFSGSIAGGTTGAYIACANLRGWVRPKSVSFSSANIPVLPSVDTCLTLVAGAYTSASYAASASTAGVLTLGGTAAADMHLPVVSPSEFSNSSLPWFAARVTAAAVLATNVTQVLNKSGTALCGRVSPAVQNAWNVTQSYISGLHPAEKAYLPLETGMYTYCPPSTDLVFFADYTLNTTGGAPAAPLVQLSSDAMYNKIFFESAQTAVGAVADTVLALTVTWHLEFRTSSALFQVGLSAMTLESLHQAQLVLAEAGFFFENETHDGLLNKIIGLAKKYVPPLVGLVNPAAGKLLHMAVAPRNTIKPPPGPSKPAATSGRASGIVSSRKKRVAVRRPRRGVSRK